MTLHLNKTAPKLDELILLNSQMRTKYVKQTEKDRLGGKHSPEWRLLCGRGEQTTEHPHPLPSGPALIPVCIIYHTDKLKPLNKYKNNEY